MEVSFALRLPSEVASVPLIRALCRTNLEQLQVVTECIEDIALAVTEACANAVVHSGDTEAFAVTVLLSDDCCRIEVRDQGRGFDVGSLHTSARLAESGRGIELMRMLVDELHFEPDVNGTAVTLVKQLQLNEGSPLHTLSAG